MMKNITLSLDESILLAARARAEERGTTVNAMVRDFLERAVAPDRKAGVLELLRLMKQYPVKSRGRRWTREELHER
jgi:hypothetical protein